MDRWSQIRPLGREGERYWVRINDMARPKYLHGAWATVTGFAARSVMVRLDRPVGRFVDGQVRCPPSVLDPAGPQ